MIDQLAAAIFILTRGGEVVQQNRAANDFMHRTSALRVRAGQIAAADERVTRALRSLLASNPTQPTFLPLGELDGRRHYGAVVPLAPSSDLVALCLHAPVSDLPATGKKLVEVFGFTPREVAVLLPLMEGKSVTEVADILGVSLPTVRTHVQHLLEKTGTTRQTDLVRVVMQVLPPIRF
jgi:DNA-binding CsgD family transcriptional regulator